MMREGGFDIVVPDLSAQQMPFTITGADCQVVSILVKNGQRVEAEAGSMLMLSNDISTSVECGSCSRICAGENLLKSVYTNKGTQDG